VITIPNQTVISWTFPNASSALPAAYEGKKFKLAMTGYSTIYSDGTSYTTTV